MKKQIICLVFSAFVCYKLAIFFQSSSSQVLESFTQAPAYYHSKPELLTNPSALSNNQNLKSDVFNDKQIEELLPTLEMIRNTSKHKREKLYNAIKTLRNILIDDLNDQSELNGTIPEIKNKQNSTFNLGDEGEEKSRVTKEISNLNKLIVNQTEVNEAATNKTSDLSGVLSKISDAISKSRTPIPISNSMPTQNMLPIFRPRNGFKSEILPSAFESPGRPGMNPIFSSSMFNIPCQKASDILEDTASFVVPKEAFCELPVDRNLNPNPIPLELNSERPIGNIVPNSVSCVDVEETVAVLFKPKNVSFMQVYGNLLKKITLTVLVPYHASKLGT